MRRAAAVLSAALAFSVGAAEPLFTLSDPKGDDHGDGALVYPLRDDLRPGDLDLLQVTAWAEGQDTRFEVTFAKTIAKPDARAIDLGGTPLASVAKLGFYTFNLELYVDTDGRPSSGAVKMLPGRKAELDPGSAWEKLIVVTPRPSETRAILKKLPRVHFAAALAEGEGPVPDEVWDARLYFVPRVTVSGPKLSFTVPGKFLGGPAKASWGYLAVVSGADVAQRLNVNALGLFGNGGPQSLAIAPITGGPGTDRFGGAREGDPLQPPLVDLIVPPGGPTQEALLRDDDPKTQRPVLLPAVVPQPAKP